MFDHQLLASQSQTNGLPFNSKMLLFVDCLHFSSSSGFDEENVLFLFNVVFSDVYIKSILVNLFDLMSIFKLVNLFNIGEQFSMNFLKLVN